jgi:hypothetical protein
MELEFHWPARDWVAINRLRCRSLLFPSPRRLLHNASGLHILRHVVPVHRCLFPLIFKPSLFQSRWAILWVALRKFGDAWASTLARGRQGRQSPKTLYNALFSLSRQGSFATRGNLNRACETWTVWARTQTGPRACQCYHPRPTCANGSSIPTSRPSFLAFMGCLKTVWSLFNWAGVNQQPSVHQFRITPFWGWTKNTSSSPAQGFFNPLMCPKFFSSYLPTSPLLPPSYLPHLISRSLHSKAQEMWNTRLEESGEFNIEEKWIEEGKRNTSSQM